MFKMRLLFILILNFITHVTSAQNEKLVSQTNLLANYTNSVQASNPDLQLKPEDNLQLITITHSLSQEIQVGNSIACATSDSGLHTDNNYWRAFNLSSFGINVDFKVKNVSIGIESARSTSGTQPINCYLYYSTNPFPNGFPYFLNLIGSSTINVVNQSETIINIPVNATVPAGTELVVQINTPDGRPFGNSFLIGSNNLGQTGPSYFDATICEISSPTDLADLGFERMQIVMNVTGNEILSNSRVQFVHNCSDVLADTMDVYINNILTINNFVFRSATPFLELPGNETINLGLAPSNSNSVLDTIKNISISFSEGEDYIVILEGLLNTGYSENPDNKNTDFKALIIPNAQEIGNSGYAKLLFVHGATDAPSLEIQLREAAHRVIVDSIAYNNFTSYSDLIAQDVTLDVFYADGQSPIQSFLAPLESFNEKAALVFISGFLNPSLNQNGAALGLFAALPDGNVIEFKPGIIPVELESFTSSINGTNVILQWETATEINNLGFQVERNNGNGFYSIGFVPGNGSTTEKQSYSFLDSRLNLGIYNYRLKQIDFDGNFKYTNEIQVNIGIPYELILYQNYPNPFNPVTSIMYSISKGGFVSLKIYNILGIEIATLVNEFNNAGSYNVSFNADNLSSGVYYYKLKSGSIVETKKMILLK